MLQDIPTPALREASPCVLETERLTLRGPTLAADFKTMVIDYIERRYGSGGTGRTAAE